MISNHIINVLHKLDDISKKYVVCINDELYPDVVYKHTRIGVTLTLNYADTDSFNIILYHLYQDILYTTTYFNCRVDPYFIDETVTHYFYDDTIQTKIIDNVKQILNRYNNTSKILC